MVTSSALHDRLRLVAAGETQPLDKGELIRACNWMLAEADRNDDMFRYALLAGRAAEAADALQMPELASHYRSLALTALEFSSELS